MQKIIIKDENRQDWIRMFAHLANLFFEQCEIVTEEDEEGAYEVEYDAHSKVQIFTYWQKQF